jgi:hypothetical protein
MVAGPGHICSVPYIAILSQFFKVDSLDAANNGNVIIVMSLAPTVNNLKMSFSPFCSINCIKVPVPMQLEPKRGL